MNLNVKEMEENVDTLYNKFKNDDKLKNFLKESNAIIDTDEKRDEVYYSKESYYDVSKKGKIIDGHGDTLYGLRVRLEDEDGLKRIKYILSIRYGLTKKSYYGCFRTYRLFRSYN